MEQIPFPNKKYQIIYADPPWSYRDKALPGEMSEQTAIATSLSDMDAELAALEARRAKTHALKQAMMQELLTGRTRLVRTDDCGAEAC